MERSTLALVVHDLKNALGHLEAQLERLQREPTPDGAHQAHAHCAELRNRFVQYLTLYGRDGPLEARLQDESPLAVLEHLRRDAVRWRDAAARASIQLVVLDDGNAPAFCFIDEHLVRLALDAALHNALRFARSRVSLHARAEGRGVCFVVDDDGPGLGPQDATTARSTGLGTALCEAVARAHRSGAEAGQVRLSNRPDGGARFELFLP